MLLLKAVRFIQDGFHNNILLILQEQERALYNQLEKEEDSKTLLSKLQKAKAESTDFAPITLNTHYDSLNSTGTWQKF